MFNLNYFFKSKTSILYVLCCLFILFVYLLTENTSISVYELVADPNEVGQVASYTGFVSTIGTLIFSATATICLFCAYLIGQIEPRSKKWSTFLKFSGYFVLLLLADDLWQIHENFFTLLLGETNNRAIQNLHETIVFGIYGLLFGAYIIRFKKLLYQTKLLTLILTFLFFGLSAIIDLLLEDISGHFILEEGFKLLGIVSFSIYYFEVCFQQVRRSLMNDNMLYSDRSNRMGQHSAKQLFK